MRLIRGSGRRLHARRPHRRLPIQQVKERRNAAGSKEHGEIAMRRVLRVVLWGSIAVVALVGVLEDWCPPFAGYFLYYPGRRQQPAALSALTETLRL